MTKYAVTADLQFDVQSRLSSLTPEGITTRLRDTVKCFEWVVDEAVENGCEGLIVVGDVFDSRTMLDVSVIDECCRAFAYASDHLEHIFVLVGNHDAYLRAPGINSLQMLRASATVVEEVSIYDNLGFVPWIDDRDKLKVAFEEIVLDPTAEFLFAHAMFEGAVPMAKGLPMDWLKRPGGKWKGVFLGDVHDPVELTKTARYVGSPLQINFGDADGARGFVIFDDETGEWEFVENMFSPRFHIVKSLDAVDDVSEGDFVRVKCDDPGDVEEILDAVRTKTSWVECLTVPPEKWKPRIKVSPDTTDKEVIRRYCRYVDNADKDVIELGLELLEEARAEA